MKRCSKCGIEKDKNCFSKHKTARGGLRPVCKSCIKITSATYYSKNKDVINKRNKEYWAKNKETLNEWQKQYTIDHKEEKHQYYLDNKESIYEKKREYENSRLKTDINFRLRKNTASAIRNFIKSQGQNKNGLSIIDYLPYTIQELKDHLEKQFEPWMTWDNWGMYNPNTWDDNDASTWTWQIDHIIPHSNFKYSSMEDEEFRKCWSLENLRPLNAKRNLLEGLTRYRHQK